MIHRDDNDIAALCQPRQQNIGMKTRFRHYVNLGRMESRIRALTRDFHWDRMDRIFLGPA